MNIPLVDLNAQYHAIQSEIDRAVLGVLESGKFVLGPNVTGFEREAAAYLGVGHAIGVASGTDALVLALRVAGVASGHEVILPAYGFFAIAGAVLLSGARPVFVDIDPKTYLLDAGKLEAAITPATRAVIVVHLYGQPADMDTIAGIAARHRLVVVEDAAQAFGAEFKGRKAGGLTFIGCLSFHPAKNLGAYGDAGMLTTNDDEAAAQVRMLRTHGWRKKYYPEMVGYNSRLDEMQAAVLRVKLRYIDQWNLRRREIAAIYSREIRNMGLEPPFEAPDRIHTYYRYMLALSGREAIRDRLAKEGIESEAYFPQALHLADPCRALGYREGQFPVAEHASRSLLALPLYPEMTGEQIARVLAVLELSLPPRGQARPNAGLPTAQSGSKAA